MRFKHMRTGEGCETVSGIVSVRPTITPHAAAVPNRNGGRAPAIVATPEGAIFIPATEFGCTCTGRGPVCYCG